MMPRALKIALVLGLSLALLGCVTHFSPQAVRSEITRQTGQDPQKAFELALGEATLKLAKSLLGSGSDGSLPLGGLEALELAVYEVPATGRPLDFTTMTVRGWESLVRSKTAKVSGMVLVRGSEADRIGDLVLVAAGPKKAIYARLRGSLKRELPDALGRAVEEGGVEAIQKQLMSVTEDAD